MVFVFEIDKAIAATAFLLQKQAGELDMYLGLKMLYIADKEALIRWGKTITGDKFVAMPKGPVLSEIYDLFKGSDRKGDHQARWDSVFSQKVNNSIHRLREVEIEILSEREMEVLEFARKEVNGCAPWEVGRWLHEVCPEWQDPKGSSKTISPEVILRNAGRAEAEIKRIESSNALVHQVRQLLDIR
jgi:uncharacterized phage-associated protein